MNKLTTLFTCLIFISAAQAQISLDVPANLDSRTDTRPHIDVTGSAETDISPDIIIISVRLAEYEENKVKIPLEKIDSDFLSAVAEAKVDKKNVQLSDVSATSITRKRKDRDTHSQKTYKITFSKVDDVLIFFEKLKKVKSDYVDIIKLSHTELEKYRLEVKIAALKAAMEKADALANAAGVKRGKVLIIQEGATVSDYFSRSNSNIILGLSSNAIVDYGNDSDDNQVPFEKITLRFEINARFAIE